MAGVGHDTAALAAAQLAAGLHDATVAGVVALTAPADVGMVDAMAVHQQQILDSQQCKARPEAPGVGTHGWPPESA